MEKKNRRKKTTKGRKKEKKTYRGHQAPHKLVLHEPVRVQRRRGAPRAHDPEPQQSLVGGVDDRMDALGEHRAAARGRVRAGLGRERHETSSDARSRTDTLWK